MKERVEAKKKSENANEDVKTGGKEEVRCLLKRSNI